MKTDCRTFDIFSKYRSKLMGIAIISIIIFHFTEDCSIYKMKYEGIVYYYNRYIGSSFVDVFLFLSGFGLYYYFSNNKGRKLSEFYFKHISKIIITYLIIVFVPLLWRDMVMDGKSLWYFIQDLTFIKLITNGAKWHWYIFMIIICYLISPWVYSVFERARDDTECHLRLLNIISFITVMAVLLKQSVPDLFGNNNIWMLRFPAFCFGFYIARLAYEKRKIPLWLYPVGGISAVFLILRNIADIIVVRYIMGLFAIYLSFLIVSIFAYIPDRRYIRKIGSLLDWFGAYTLELYLLHVTIRGLLNRYGLNTSHYRYELIVIAGSLILTPVVRVLVNAVNHSLNKTGKVSV